MKLFVSFLALILACLQVTALTNYGSYQFPDTFEGGQETLIQMLDETLAHNNLKAATKLSDPNQNGVFSEKNEQLRGNRQRSYKHTPAGTMEGNFKMTSLDDYVSRPDSHYEWYEFPQFYDEGAYQVHFLNVTSQKWLDESLVSRPIWWHIVAVIRPQGYETSDHGVTYITGSGNPAPGQLPPLREESIIFASNIAVETKSIAVVIWQIPNQRLTFPEERPTPKSRTEDAIIAYTWDHFMKSPEEPDWLLRNPMVKGANRVLDAVEEYAEKKWNHILKHWLISGASKRGWTTWILAAYDQAHEKRVVGAVPMVESFLNMRKQFHSWWQSVGGWSFALEDYYAMNFTQNFDTPVADRMGEVIDPYNYFDRYVNLPILQVMASGDEFFQLTDTELYWNSIPGEKFLLVIQNAEHSLATGLLTLLPSITSFAKSLRNNLKRPQLSWKFDRARNRIIVETDVEPTSASVWFGKTFSQKRIDFRVIRLETPEEPCQFPKIQNLCPQPIIWLKRSATRITSTRYEAEFTTPPNGWASFFIQLQYENVGGGSERYPHIFTTEAIVFPNEKPFPPCTGQACHGKLI